MSKSLYIEGTTDQDNGNLRAAFVKLLGKELKDKMPRVIMGDGVKQTIDKFMCTPLKDGEVRFLLIDSDRRLDKVVKNQLIEEYNKKENKKQSCSPSNTFFMVQEAEAWILSQPKVLNSCQIRTNQLPKRNVQEIEKPSLVLAGLYKQSGKQYHKVRDFSKVVVLLDTAKLKDDISEFNGLITQLLK